MFALSGFTVLNCPSYLISLGLFVKQFKFSLDPFISAIMSKLGVSKVPNSYESLPKSYIEFADC